MDDANFAKLQNMAKLKLTSDEALIIKNQLDEALQAVQVFEELDTTHVEPLNHPGDLTNVMRDDAVTPSLSQASALSNATRTHDGYFLVSAIFEDNDN